MARRTAPPAPVAEPLFEAPARQPNILSEIPTHLIDEIQGRNPRTDYGDNDGTFAGLVDSIRQKGILQPLLIGDHPTDSDRWALVDGARRLSAARAAGLERVPCVVLPHGDADPGHIMALTLTANLQRRDLNPLEEADGFLRLESLGWSQDAIGRTVGRSQSHVSRALSLLGLPEGTRTMLREGLLSASHGAELVRLLGMLDPESLDMLAGQAIQYDWSVGALRVSVAAEIREINEDRAAAQTTIPVDPDPAPAREYATSHKSPTAAATAPDALTRPAAAPEVKPGYTPADAKAEYEASQQPDPDETTPVQDAIRAAKERAQEEPATERVYPEGMAPGEDLHFWRPDYESHEREGVIFHAYRFVFNDDDHRLLLDAGYEEDYEDDRLDTANLAVAIVEWERARGRTVDFRQADVDALKALAAERKPHTPFDSYGWADYVDYLVQNAVAGRPPISPRCADLLGKIAEHYDRTPEEQLYAILGTRWASIEAEAQKGEVG